MCFERNHVLLISHSFTVIWIICSSAIVFSWSVYPKNENAHFAKGKKESG